MLEREYVRGARTALRVAAYDAYTRAHDAERFVYDVERHLLRVFPLGGLAAVYTDPEWVHLERRARRHELLSRVEDFYGWFEYHARPVQVRATVADVRRAVEGRVWSEIREGK